MKIGTVVNETPKIEWQFPGMLSKVPYAEPSSFQGFHSAYFNESHHRFRKAVREFIANEIEPEAMVNDANGETASEQVFQKMGEFGLLACRMGPGPHMKGMKLPGGITPEEFDYVPLVVDLVPRADCS